MRATTLDSGWNQAGKTIEKGDYSKSFVVVILAGKKADYPLIAGMDHDFIQAEDAPSAFFFGETPQKPLFL